MTEGELCPLDTHAGVLAEDVISPLNVPPADNSAMDGYAVNPGPLESGRMPIGLFRQRGIVRLVKCTKACSVLVNVSGS